LTGRAPSAAQRQTSSPGGSSWADSRQARWLFGPVCPKIPDTTARIAGINCSLCALRRAAARRVDRLPAARRLATRMTGVPERLLLLTRLSDWRGDSRRLYFNGFPRVVFQGSRITSDAGLILVRELIDRWSLTSVQQRLVKTGGRLVKQDDQNRNRGCGS